MHCKMEIIKTPNEYESYNITIIEDDLKVIIAQTGLDQTLTIRYLNLQEITDAKMVISSDYKELYEIFDKLYTSIIDGNVLGEDITNPRVLERSNKNKEYSIYKKLVSDDKIIFPCDAYPLICPNTLTISKQDNKITLDFHKEDGSPYHEYKSRYSISVNIRQSGCRFDPFNIPFNTMFKELQTINVKDSSLKALKKVPEE